MAANYAGYSADDRVRVTRAPVRFKLVAPPGHSYYRTLREKLNWGGQFQRRKEEHCP